MREKTAITKDSAVFLQCLAAASAQINDPERKGGKIDPIKAALLAACGQVADGSRLPPLREMAAAANTTMVTIQRAVAELAREGALVSRERSGVFSRHPACLVEKSVQAGEGGESAGRVDSTGGQLPLTAFVFATDSMAPYQQAFWQEASEGFLAKNVYIQPQVLFAAENAEREGRCDVCERHIYRQPAESTVSNLSLREYLTGPFEQISRFLLNDQHLALYYRTYFLFYRPQQLQKIGMPLPAYRTFQEQEEYLRAAQPVLERAGMLRPLSILRPHTLMARALPQRIHHCLEGRESLPDFEAVARFCQLMRFDINRDRPLEEFRNGSSPLFLGYSVTLWELISSTAGFDWEVYPLLRSDDTLPLLPMTATIRGDTRRPLECIRFLQFLLSERMQGRFVEQGCLRADRSPALFDRCPAAGVELMQKALMEAEPLFLPQEQEGYLVENIFGGELWQAVLHGLPVEACLANAIAFGRHYHARSKNR